MKKLILVAVLALAVVGFVAHPVSQHQQASGTVTTNTMDPGEGGGTQP